MDKDDKISKLKEYFADRRDIPLAYLYGSQIRGRTRRDSDWDVAVVFKNGQQWGKTVDEVSQIVGREVDLIDLSEAPASLTSLVLKSGTPLTIKSRKLYWDVFLKTSAEAEDFLQFARDYRKIYLRSKSLINEDRLRLLERVQFIDSELEDLDDFRSVTLAEYQEDKTVRRNMERWAETICNATIDAAKIILASHKRPMARTYAGVLLQLGALIGLTERDAERLAGFAELRNIIAHEYLEVIYGRLRHFIKAAPRIYKKFFVYVETLNL